MTSLQAALDQFAIAEANLSKLEKLWAEIEEMMPRGPAFGSPPEYERACYSFEQILTALPAIEGWRVENRLLDYDTIGQMQLDVAELGMIEASVTLDRELDEQGRQLREYRLRLDTKRRALIRERVLQLIDEVDATLRQLWNAYQHAERNTEIEGDELLELKTHVAEIDTLLGSSVQRPRRWNDLHRHLHFAMVGDLFDIREHDWPEVKQGLRPILYGDHDPLPGAAADLGELVASKPRGGVATKLAWDRLDDEQFERLIFQLISDSESYENPEWLQQTNAPDRGRDLSVTRVINDPLLGPRRQRVLIQCKHWLSKSVGVADLATLTAQMPLWEPPRVDMLIIATSGRFTADAISSMEKQNAMDKALHVVFWPESHLERLLASRPHLVAEFGLRGS
jgi:hypothetical protein